MSLVVGIDLGTTNSCIAVYRNNRVEIIERKDGYKTLPSYVYYEDNGPVLVGKQAFDKSRVYPERCIYDSKRLIGIPFNDGDLQMLIKTLPFDVIEGKDGECQIIVFQKGQKRIIRPEEVSSEILRELKQTAEEVLGEKIINAVITVPAYFNNAQKQATKDAAKIAGLNVLKLVTEPVAAALAFTHKTELKKEKMVLVYDLGGGTFDVSLMRLSNKKINTIAIGGDNFLGGRDFDSSLKIHILNTIEQDQTLTDLERRRIDRRLEKECENLKKNLSTARAAELELSQLGQKDSLEISITRETFENLNMDHFKDTIKILDKLFSDMRINKRKIDEILLVGGSTRIPKIQQMVQDYFEGKELNNTVNPDEAVAIGAAIQGALLSDHPAQKCEKYAIIDVVPRSLGIEVVGEKSMSVLVERNTKIPCEIKKTYFTHKDYQENAIFRVFEGESADINNNIRLGEFVINDITRKKKGEVQFEVTFSLDLNGILKVTAVETLKNVSNNLEIILNSGRMSNEEIKESHERMLSRKVR